MCFCFFCVGFSGKNFVLLGSRLLLVTPRPLCAFAFLSWFLWDSFCFVRVQASLGPCPTLVWFVFLSWLLWYRILFFFGSRLLWVTPHPLCAFAFLSWLLWDSFSCSRVPASLGPLCPVCAFAFLSLFLWDNFCFVRFPASLSHSPPLMCFCFSVLASLGQLLVFVRVQASLGPCPTLVCFCFSVLASLGQLLLFKSPGFSESPRPLVCFAFLCCFLMDNFCFVRFPGFF